MTQHCQLLGTCSVFVVAMASLSPELCWSTMHKALTRYCGVKPGDLDADAQVRGAVEVLCDALWDAQEELEASASKRSRSGPSGWRQWTEKKARDHKSVKAEPAPKTSVKKEKQEKMVKVKKERAEKKTGGPAAKAKAGK